MLPHRAWRWLLAAVFAAVTAPAFAAYTDPDAPETEAAARAALPNAVMREIEARVRDIVGLGSEIKGRVTDLDRAKRDLGAQETDLEIRIQLPADVLFDFDKTNIRRDAEEALGKVLVILRAHSASPITIEGHTDGKGRPAYNQKLSERRSESVKAWLVTHGVPARLIRTNGFGMRRPVAPNTKPDGSDDPAGRQKNRRVEIVVHKGKKR
jgi:outer membrane protein OmpA-like peptidoglycan-associated protein